MSSVITVTFNPALDKSILVHELISDKKMKCWSPVYEPGGGGINVARAIKKLGGNATAIYLAGGDAGKKITHLLKNEFIDSVVTKIREPTRENLVVAETSSGKQYLFDMPGPLVSEDEWQKCLDDIDGMSGLEYIVASGSLPPGVPMDIFARLASIAKRKNARLIVDTSGEPLRHAIQTGVYLIKPNLRELGLLVGRENISAEEAPAIAREIINNSRCEMVLVSMGADGAMLLTRDEDIKVSLPPQTIKSTVGAGDSLTAGFVLSLLKNTSLRRAIQYGVACGTAATMNSGTELCEKSNADYLYNLLKNESCMA